MNEAIEIALNLPAILNQCKFDARSKRKHPCLYLEYVRGAVIHT
jgi:hypothetical protein